MKRTKWMRWILGAVLAGTACGAGAGAGSGDLVMDDVELVAAGEERRELTLEVENQNFHDARLYAVTEGARHRQQLGYISAYNKETFTFRWLPTFELRIEIDLVSVGRYLTPPLPVEEGDELQLIIEPDLHRQRPIGR